MSLVSSNINISQDETLLDIYGKGTETVEIDLKYDEVYEK
jgi:ribosomal protein L25 (general stress protein Ctc)